MRTVLSIFAMLFLSAGIISAQDDSPKESKYQIGFNLVYPTGNGPSTALTNSPQPFDKSFGLGVTIQRKMGSRLSLFFDINAYNYNMFLASKGSDVQSIWTVEESATHWDEAGAPQIQYVHNLPTDVHFDMQSAGMRLGAKYYLGEKTVRPWVGAGFGFYSWEVNYYNEDKSQTYGSDDGYVWGMTMLGGVDFKITRGVIITAFADLLTPIAEYTIEGLFYPQWDITDYQSPIMGAARFGVTISFAPTKPEKKK